MTEKFNSVWDALEDTPQEAENMKIRSELMIVLTRELTYIDGTQMQKAKQLGITQPRLNDLLQGRINKFSIDALVTIASNVGLSVSLVTRTSANNNIDLPQHSTAI